MNKLFLYLLLVLNVCAQAQEDCKFTVVDSGEGKEYKSTKEYVMYEKVFGGTSTFVFFSLAAPDGVPVLNFQLLAKSDEFPPAYCIDKNSRIYMQLTNGKIITLINVFDERCSTLLYDSENKKNIRVLTGSFLFTKGTLEDLEKFPISFMRIKYSTETVDYPVRNELTSETNNEKYFPDKYFMNYLKCLE